jgi:outer membrane protein assembly factor BamD (BamD/ComL family)
VGTAERAETLEEGLVQWVNQNRRTAITVGVIVAVVAGGIWFGWTARERREMFAERALATARTSAEAGNLPLASSDLSRLTATYSGTRAAEEATLLLAQVRLLQKQPALAIGDLRKFVASGPRKEFLGPANGLLGAALEEAGQPGEAAKAYEASAATTPYRGIKAQELLDAARTYSSIRDTTKAAAIYDQLIRDFKDQSSALEARVRLAELRKSPLNHS